MSDPLWDTLAWGEEEDDSTIHKLERTGSRAMAFSLRWDSEQARHTDTLALSDPVYAVWGEKT